MHLHLRWMLWNNTGLYSEDSSRDITGLSGWQQGNSGRGNCIFGETGIWFHGASGEGSVP